jgi:protein-disulfide isomerase
MKKLFLTAATILAANAAFAEKDLDKAAVENIIREFIIANPEVIIESVNQMQIKEMEKQQEEAGKVIKEKFSEIVGGEITPYAGNPDGDIVIVEFFDYNCGFCKQAMPVVQQLIEEDKGVKVVFKEHPILHETSEVAARASLAVNIVDKSKYFDFHTRLMSFQGQKTKETVLRIAEEAGLDKAKVEKEMNNEKVSAEIAKSQEHAEMVGMRGVPAFIIGGELVGGAVDLPFLKNRIAMLREKK